MKFRCKYEYHKPFGYPKHVWTCIGRHGAMHFHVTDMGEDFKHGDRAPSQDKCWLIGCPCWHDGTSLYAHERWIPF